MRSQSSLFFGVLGGAALLLGLSGAARAQVAPVAGYEDEAAYAAPEAQPYAAPYAPEAQPYAAPQAGFAFAGAHPVPHDHGGGFCQAEGVHSHDYAPFDDHLFRVVNGAAVFVGDPADFGYSTPYMYAGNHPLEASYGGGYCYIGWGHRHLFAPVSAGFTLVGGAYSYVGPFGADYYGPRLSWASYYDGYYRANYYGGRYWSLRPQPIYAGWGHRYGWGYGSGWGYRPAAPVYRPGWGGYRAPVYAPRPYAAPVAPMYRPAAPFVRPAAVYAPRPYAAPMAPAYRPAPAYAPRPYAAPMAPAYRPAPAYAPRPYAAPMAPAAPMYRPAPTFHAPAPAFHGGGAPVFHGGGGHFGGGHGHR